MRTHVTLFAPDLLRPTVTGQRVEIDGPWQIELAGGISAEWTATDVDRIAASFTALAVELHRRESDAARHDLDRDNAATDVRVRAFTVAPSLAGDPAPLDLAHV